MLCNKKVEGKKREREKNEKCDWFELHRKHEERNQCAAHQVLCNVHSKQHQLLQL